MKICITTANLGGIDKDDVPHAAQTVPTGWQVFYKRYTDKNFPLRVNALHPRLQAKIPKMLSHELNPGYDKYIWLDGSMRLARSDSIVWLTDKSKDVDIVLVRHPARTSIRDELNFCLKVADQKYFKDRYENEPMLEQVNSYYQDEKFTDNELYANGLFIYDKNLVNQTPNMLTEWFYHNARYSIQDQLSLPYLIHKWKPTRKILEINIFQNPYFRFLGHR